MTDDSWQIVIHRIRRWIHLSIVLRFFGESWQWVAKWQTLISQMTDDNLSYLYLYLYLYLLMIDVWSRALRVVHNAMWSSKRFSKLLTEGAATTWFGNEFHKLTVLCEKKYFLTLSRHDFLYNFSWCPRRFNSREANWNMHVGSISSLRVRILYTSIKSPRCRLFSNVVIFNNCNLCSYALPFIPVTHSVLNQVWRPCLYAVFYVRSNIGLIKYCKIMSILGKFLLTILKTDIALFADLIHWVLDFIYLEGHNVLDGDPAPPKGHRAQPPIFGPCLM